MAIERNHSYASLNVSATPSQRLMLLDILFSAHFEALKIVPRSKKDSAIAAIMSISATIGLNVLLVFVLTSKRFKLLSYNDITLYSTAIGTAVFSSIFYYFMYNRFIDNERHIYVDRKMNEASPRIKLIAMILGFAHIILSITLVFVFVIFK